MKKKELATQQEHMTQLDENSALMSSPADIQEEERKRKKGAAIIVGATVVTAGVVTAIAVGVQAPSIVTKIIPDPFLVSVLFNTPSAGNMMMTFHNGKPFPISVTEIDFTTNAYINFKQAGVLFGDLVTSVSSIMVVSSPTSFDYKIFLETPTTISPGSKNTLGYVFMDANHVIQAKGVLPVGELPRNILLNTPQGYLNPTLANVCQGTACIDPYPGKKVGGYYRGADMYQREYNVGDLPVDKINRVYYSLGFDASGNLVPLDSNSDNIQIPMLMQLKQQYPFLQVMISLGDSSDTTTDNLSALAANPAASQTFANNLLLAFQQFGLDGVVIQWEKPTDTFANLLKIIRRTFDSSGKKYEISFSSTGFVPYIHGLSNLIEINQYVDVFNVWASEYIGYWVYVTGPLAPWYLSNVFPVGVKPALDAYKALGIPANKISIGMPTYYCGMKVHNATSKMGFNTPIIGIPPGQFHPAQGDYTCTYAKPGQSASFDYTCVMNQECFQFINLLPRDCIFVPDSSAPLGGETKSPWIYCPVSNQVYSGISPVTAQAVTCYASQENYAGVFYSPLSGDSRKNPANSLVTTSYNTWHDPNCVPPSTNNALVTVSSPKTLLSVSEEIPELPSSDVELSIDLQDLKTVFKNGVLLSFLSTLTRDGLKKYGCAEDQIQRIEFLVKVISLGVIQGYPKDLSSQILWAVFLSTSTLIPTLVERIGANKSTANTVALGASALSTFAGFCCAPRETVAGLAASGAGIAAAKIVETSTTYLMESATKILRNGYGIFSNAYRSVCANEESIDLEIGLEKGRTFKL